MRAAAHRGGARARGDPVGANATAPAPHDAEHRGAGIETIMVAPQFPQPMYEPLRELSQELLLPGLGRALTPTA